MNTLELNAIMDKVAVNTFSRGVSMRPFANKRHQKITNNGALFAFELLFFRGRQVTVGEF